MATDRTRVHVTCPHCSGAVVIAVGVDAGADPQVDPAKASPDWLQETWNARKSKVQIKSLKLSPSLRAMAKARIKEIPTKRDWLDIIDAIAKNAHCNGQNDRQWVADFAYLVRAKTPLRILERVRHQQQHGGVKPTSARDVQRASREQNVGHVAEDGMYTPDELLDMEGRR